MSGMTYNINADTIVIRHSMFKQTKKKIQSLASCGLLGLSRNPAHPKFNWAEWNIQTIVIILFILYLSKLIYCEF